MRSLITGLLLAMMIAPSLSCIAGAESTFKRDVDVTGADYRHFDLPRPRPRLCQQACLAEEQCRAWTFYRAGLLGPRAICWLKSGVPIEHSDQCCISGWK
jgi:hypothetical protein